MQPYTVGGIKIAFDVISMCFAVLRVWATRKKPKSALRNASHVLLFATVISGLVPTAIFVKCMIDENRLIQQYAGNMILVNMSAGLPEYQKKFFISHFLYQLSLYLLKIAYLTHYAQLFVRTITKKKLMLYAGAAVTVICFVVELILHFTWCIPVTKNWDLTQGCSVVFSFDAFAVFSAMNIFSDLTILATPILVISDLYLNRHEYYALIGIFLLGSSSIIASVVRFGILGDRIRNVVYTWDTMHIYGMVSHYEVMLGIIAFALPAFRPYLSRILRRKDQTSYSTDKDLPLPGGRGPSARRGDKATATVRLGRLVHDEEVDIEMDRIVQVRLRESEEQLHSATSS